MAPFIAYVSSTTGKDLECSTLYFFNGIKVYISTISEELYLETPGNISLNNGFDQRVEHVLSYNVVYNETTGAFMFKTKQNEPFEGFFISKISLCSKPISESLSLLTNSIRYPFRNPFNESVIPEEVKQMYVRNPNPKVVELVVPAFEKWFEQIYGLNTSNASLIGLASAAALFVYGTFIEYTAGATPRSIEDVIEARRGDCDDMSRVLVELLNYYDIPAVITYGYVYMSNFNYNISVENVTYFYLNNGPHAFTMAYIPGYGWLSLDLLAGSFLKYLIVLEGYTRDTSVSREEIEEFINLHRALKAKQIIAVLNEEEFNKIIGSKLDFNNIYLFFKSVANDDTIDNTTSTKATISSTTLETTPSTTNVNTTIGQSIVITTNRPCNTTFIKVYSPEATTKAEQLHSAIYIILFCLVVLALVSLLYLYKTRSML